ncbi:hypothetical protein KGF54_000620 [Candida jiufengensis]|uniref:uncharacterized protein n=1 Tax=Candida jiufengensis TaxID=497108 RepID=UPI002224CA62|nr:uncharacterized protein KGF54_000620 [Candida jiufengensis]KAI5957001.1 hypothetical protein KGF54_000620 [Candida jiufengensis]
MLTISIEDFIEQIPTNIQNENLNKLREENCSDLKDLIKNSITQSSNDTQLTTPTSTSISSNTNLSTTTNTELPKIHKQAINMSDIILDVENLNSSNELTIEENINEEEFNSEVIEYLKFKKNHQLKFWKEVNEKGLNVKSNKVSVNKFMNY